MSNPVRAVRDFRRPLFWLGVAGILTGLLLPVVGLVQEGVTKSEVQQFSSEDRVTVTHQSGPGNVLEHRFSIVVPDDAKGAVGYRYLFRLESFKQMDGGGANGGGITMFFRLSHAGQELDRYSFGSNLTRPVNLTLAFEFQVGPERGGEEVELVLQVLHDRDYNDDLPWGRFVQPIEIQAIYGVQESRWGGPGDIAWVSVPTGIALAILSWSFQQWQARIKR